MGWEYPKFPQNGKFPNPGNSPGIPIWEIPGREKFEATREGGNGNFSLNIPEVYCLILFVGFVNSEDICLTEL